MSPAMVAGLLAGLGVALFWRPRPRLSRQADSAPGVVEADQGLLFRLRWPLAALGFMAGWIFFGGVIGMLAGAVVAVWSVRALASAEGPTARARRDELERDLPTGVDLLGATVAAGGAVDQGLALVAGAFPGALAAEFLGIHRRLGMGADPVTVWVEVTRHEQLAPLGRAMVRAHESGASVGTAIVALAAELRDRARFDVESRARSVDVKSAGPLGLCLLPAFVLIGVVPMVAGIFAASGLF